jgi:hypothetical protein
MTLYMLGPIFVRAVISVPEFRGLFYFEFLTTVTAGGEAK